jgi:hypothetical protein
MRHVNGGLELLGVVPSGPFLSVPEAQLDQRGQRAAPSSGRARARVGRLAEQPGQTRTAFSALSRVEGAD